MINGLPLTSNPLFISVLKNGGITTLVNVMSCRVIAACHKQTCSKKERDGLLTIQVPRPITGILQPLFKVKDGMYTASMLV
jgi:hypothetical protein